MNLHTSHRALHAVAIIAVAILGTSFASAQVELYALRKEQSYVQTADATVVAETFRLDAQIRTANAGDLGAAVLTGGVGGPVALTQQGQYWNYYSAGYGTEAELDAAYPNANYQLELSGGILPVPETMSIDMPALYPTATPMLTGTTFSGLNAWNPADGDFLMTFSSHLANPGASFVLTYLTFYDQTLNNGVPTFFSLSSDTTSHLLDSSLFVAGHEYRGNLQFFHQYSNPDEPYFATIKGIDTTFEFTTSTGSNAVPDSSVSGILALTLVGFVVAHRRWSSTNHEKSFV